MQIHRSLSNLPVFRKSVITIGSFDGVHIGHQKIISRINSLASETKGESIIITLHPHPKQIIFPHDKSVVLLTSLEEKISLFEKSGVDHLVIVPFSIEFSQQDPREYIEKFLYEKFKPSYIVIGYDHRFGLNRGGDINLLKSYEEKFNFTTVQIEKQELEEIAISSTKIRQAIINNEILLANSFLNYNYKITGRVIYGEQLGTKLGYKTANLKIDDSLKLLPQEGIYAVYVIVDHVRYGGMLYIGNKPTIHEQFGKSIEVNIFDFDQDIYGEKITVELIDFIRNDKKFDGLEGLKIQLGEDELKARKIIDLKNYKIEDADVAIVILNYNGEEMLESYLPSCLHSSDRVIDYVVIDNHSSDDSVEFVEEWHPEFKLIKFTKNYGYAGGYNLGLKQLNHKYIALINSDIQCTQNWLDPIIDLMEKDETIAVVSPKIRSIEEPDKFEYAGGAGGFMDFLAYPFCRGRIFDHVEEDKNQYETEQEVFWASGAAMIVRKKVFDEIGGFDDSYFAHQEEIDLCWRMKRAGYKIMAYPNTKVYHLGGGTLSYESPNKTYLNFRNNLITMIKNDESPFWFFKFLFRLVLDGIAAIQILSKGQTANTWAIARAHWFIIPKFFHFLQKRKNTKTIIEKMRIGNSNKNGLYRSSIVWQYFIKGKKTFSKLNYNG